MTKQQPTSPGPGRPPVLGNTKQQLTVRVQRMTKLRLANIKRKTGQTIGATIDEAVERYWREWNKPLDNAAE